MGGWVRDRLLWDKQQETHKSQKEETEIYEILKFGVDRAYIERDTAIQKFTKKYRKIPKISPPNISPPNS